MYLLKNIKNKVLFLISLSIVLFSCHQYPSHSSQLERAEEYALLHNDSAWILLETIPKEKLTEEVLARYFLVWNMAKRYNSPYELCDSTLCLAEEYYRQENDRKRLGEIFLLQGWINYYRKDYQQAEEKYQQALDLWLSLNDSTQIARAYRELSWVTNSTGKKDTTILLIEKSLPYCAAGQIKMNHHLYLGSLYAKEKKVEEAVAHYRSAYDGASSLDSRYLHQTIRNYIVQLYLDTEMYKDAFLELDTFRHMKRGRYETAYSTLVRAEIWMKTHQYDSAYYYYTLASQSQSPHIAAEANSRLASLHELKGDYKNAVSALRSFSQLWENNATSLEGKHLRKDYEEIKLRNELNEIKLAKKNRDIYLIVLFATLLVCLLIGYFIYLRSKKKKEERRLKQQTEMLEKENRLLKQAEELSVLRQKESNLREALFKRMTVFQKIPSLEKGSQESKDDKRIILSEKEWEEIIQVVNSNYDNFVDRLKKEFPKLTFKDIQFCCLIKINVTLKDLSDIYCVSKSAIVKKKFRIKTEKLHFMDGNKSLDDFLKNF